MFNRTPFSKRKKLAENPQKTLVYQYDKASEKLRKQVILILKSALGTNLYQDRGVLYGTHSTASFALWNHVFGRVRKPV
jgi:hypothetical protein